VESGGTPKSDVEAYWGGGIPWATLVDLPATDFISEISTTKRTITEKGLRDSSAKMIPANSVVVSTRATIGRIAINRVPIATNQGFKNVIIQDSARALPEFVALSLTKLVPQMKACATGGTFAEISKSKFCELQIPLPPLAVQQEIVAEIEGYQKVINGARAVLDHYRPHIPIHPDWPIVEIGSISMIVRGSSPRPQGDPKYFGGQVPRLMVADITRDGMYATPQIDSLTELGATKSRPMKKGEVVITVSGNPGLPTILAIDACIHDGFVGLRELSKDVLPTYLYFALLALHASHGAQSVGAVFRNLTTDQIREFKIPLPPLATQRAIVAEIEAEQALVSANRELITRFEQKIQTTLARVWGEEKIS
jgi:type I restriction enzyme M protein